MLQVLQETRLKCRLCCE